MNSFLSCCWPQVPRAGAGSAPVVFLLSQVWLHLRGVGRSYCWSLAGNRKIHFPLGIKFSEGGEFLPVQGVSPLFLDSQENELFTLLAHFKYFLLRCPLLKLA